VTIPDNGNGKGAIAVINTVRRNNRPMQLLQVIELNEKGVEGIAVIPYSDKMLFTNRVNDSKGLGVLEITDNSVDNFSATVRKEIKLQLGSVQDYWELIIPMRGGLIRSRAICM
jgi:hypothetical protein